MNNTESQKSKIKSQKEEVHPLPSTLHPLHSVSGQGVTEMIFVIPLFVMLAAGVISISYMCWQGLKVQAAANAAARVAGQETVGGALNSVTLMQDNGLLTDFNVGAQGDPDPTATCGGKTDPKAQADCYHGLRPTTIPQTHGVYWEYRDMVRNLFNAGEKEKVFVPPPTIRDFVTEVTVSRTMQAPKVFGWQMPPVTVKSTAYGGEDSFMYGLPRFGRTNPTQEATPGQGTFWQNELAKMKHDNPGLKSDSTGE